ncbi:iron-containing redox enzyme family protein [Myxococcota bacterium]|nr:iron-containing redox enzyme family protein [Myxococcota bacterium]
MDALLVLDLESQAHSAVNHVWLRNVAAHRYCEMESVLRRFAQDYCAYASGFPSYLCSLIGKLERSEHRQLLERNLQEEQGHLDPSDRDPLWALGIDPDEVDGVPHSQLYRRFCFALGLEEADLDLSDSAGRRWRQRMLAFLDTASPAAALGALGLGTEGVVRPVYRQLSAALRAVKSLKAPDCVFFDLHCAVDDQHAKDLEKVARDLLDTPRALEDMRRGMLEALRLRRAFFSHQHLCATHGFQAVSDPEASYQTLHRR